MKMLKNLMVTMDVDSTVENLRDIILNLVDKISPLAYALLVVDIVVSGIYLLIPSSDGQGKRVAKGFLIGGFIGLVLVLGATTLATALRDTVQF